MSDEPIRVDCGCGRAFQAKAALAGKQVRCPGCSRTLHVPQRGAPAAKTAAKPAATPSPGRIRVDCRCGKAFEAKAELAGKQVGCPVCGQPLTVGPPRAATAAMGAMTRTAPSANISPTPSSVPRVRVACRCGQAFQAKAELAGQHVSCPSCRQPLVIPHSNVQTGPSPGMAYGASADPLGSASSSADLFGFSDDELFGGSAAAAPARTLPPSSAAPPRPVKRKRRRKNYRYQEDKTTVCIGIACILFCLGRLGLWFAWSSAMSMMPSTAGLSSLPGMIMMFSLALTVGIGIAGVGLLTGQDWAEGLGLLVAIIYIIASVISIVTVLGRVAQINPDLIGQILPRLIPRLIGHFMVPVLLIYESQRAK